KDSSDLETILTRAASALSLTRTRMRTKLSLSSGEITPDTLIIAHHVVSPPKRPPWTEPLRAVVPDNTPDQWRFRREHACIFGSEAPVLRIISALWLLRQIRSTVNKSRGLVCKPALTAVGIHHANCLPVLHSGGAFSPTFSPPGAKC